MVSIATLQTLSGPWILVGLVITTAVIVLVPNWRFALFALLAQYVLSTFLLATFTQPSFALVRALSGALATAILYITFRHTSNQLRHPPVDAAREPLERPQAQPIFVVGFPFRLLALALVAVSIVGIASSMTFLGLSGEVLFSGLWLIAAGILVAILSRDVLRLGLGILTFTGGFCNLETATEGSLFLYGLLNLSDLLLALVIANLRTLPTEETEQHRRRGEAE